MKGTMKRIVSILLALALVITSINYTPKTVNAAEDYSGLNFTEVTAGGFTDYAYSIVGGNLVGVSPDSPNFLDGATANPIMQVAFSADNIKADTIVKINDEVVEQGDVVTLIDTAIVKVNPTKFEDNAYTKVEIISTTGNWVVIVRRGTPASEEPSDEETDPVDPTVTTTTTVESLNAPTDVMLLDYHHTDDGYKVVFTDNDADVVVTEGDTKGFAVYLGEVYVGTVEKSGDTIDSFKDKGLVNGTQYAVTVKEVVERVNAEGIQQTLESESSKNPNYVYYTEENDAVLENGIAKVFVNTSRNDKTKNFDLFTNPDKTKVDASIMVVDKNGVSQVDGTDFGTIARRGNSTGGGQKKPYNIKFEKKQNLFGFGKAKKWSLLANTFDKSMIRNQVGITFHNYVEQNFQDHKYTSLGEVVDLYVDGYYLGTYYLLESVEAGGTRVDIDAEDEDSVNNEILLELDSTGRDLGSDAHIRKKDDAAYETRLEKSGYYFTMNAPEGPGKDGNDADTVEERNEFWDKYWNKSDYAYNYLTTFENEISKGAESDFDTIAQMIDVDSFVNYYITAELFKITDVAFSSVRHYIKVTDGGVYDETTGKSYKLYAGPLWDLDLSSGNNDNTTVEQLHAQDNYWFGNLMKNPKFADLVRQRYEELLPKIKDIYAEGGSIDTIIANSQKSIDANYSVAYNVHAGDADITPITGYGTGWEVDKVYDAGNHAYTPGEFASGNVHGSEIVYDNHAAYVKDFREWMEGRNKFLMKQFGASDKDAIYTEYEDMISDRFYNLALSKQTTLYKNCHAEGKQVYLNDGLFTQGQYCALTNADTTTGWGTENQPSYFTIDLGAVYDATAIDEILIQYKNGAADDTVLNKPYKILFAIDASNDANFYEVVSVDSATLDANNRTIDKFNEISTVAEGDDATNLVRYVRVYYPKQAGYGMHIIEASVLDTNKDAVIVDAETVPAPTATAEASADKYNAITGTITANPDAAKGTTYAIYVDGALVKTVDSDGAYELTGIKGGKHTVTVKAVYNGWYSDATEGVEVDVVAGFKYESQKDYTAADFIVTTKTIGEKEYYNYVKYPGLSATATEGEGGFAPSLAIDGNVGSRWGTGESDPQSITINLGTAYNIKAIAALWETASSKDYTVEVSKDGNNFNVVAMVENAASGNHRYDLITLAEEVEAQYIKITGTSRTTNYGHSIYELGIYGPDEFVEVAPDTSDVDISGWVEIPVKGADAATITNKYYINQAGYDAYVNNVIWGVFTPHTETSYHGANCLLTGNAIAFAHKDGTFNGQMYSVWVDGVKYLNNTDKFYGRGDSCEIALELFPYVEEARATETIHYVSVVNNQNVATSFAIRVTPGDVVDPTTTTEAPTDPPVVEPTKPATPIGFGYAGNANLPYYWAWQPVDGAVSYNVYIDGEYVTSTIGTAYDGIGYFADAQAGDYEISITAVNAEGVESEPATVTYTKVEDETESETESESESEPTGTVLEAPEDFILYNYRQTGEGYKVVFEDPNEVSLEEGETYSYEVYVDNGGLKLIGTVDDSKEFIGVDEIDALGLTADGNYKVYIKAVLTKADGTRVESKAGTSDFTYRTYTTSTYTTGLPQIIIQTADNSVNLWTDASKAKADSTIIVNDADGNLIYSDFGTANVRGNSTAGAEKKAYNFKFENKHDLFEMGSAKKWSLLANAFDKSLLRNKLAMDLGNAMGIPYNSQSTFVDVYVNGRYMGNYLLIESIEEGKTRVNIDSENDEEYNSNVLIELENNWKDEEGCTYITTSTYNERFVMGSPESADDITEEFFAKKVADTTNTLNAFETALAANDFAKISEIIDLESFVNFYVVTEFFKQQDIGFSSTRFFIQDGKLYAGPLWDFDLSSGNVDPGYYNGDNSSDGFHTTTMEWFGVLMQNATFKRLVKERFNEVLPEIKALYEGEGNAIDTLLAEMGESAKLNYTTTADNGAGWSISEKDQADGYSYSVAYKFQSYEEAVEHLRTWLAERTAFLEEEWVIDDSEEALLEEQVASTIYNMALGKTVTVYKRINEGSLANINDGKISLTEAQPTVGAIAPGDAGWENAGAPVYATIDLGKYYDAAAIEKILIQYKDNAANDTVVERSYSIQYSTDNIHFYDAVPNTNVESLDPVKRYTLDDVSGVEGAVRYVRVYYPTTPNYGIQISEIAILDTDADASENEIEKVVVDAPVGLTATSDKYNEITVTITGEGQEEYLYDILVDGVIVKSGVKPGETVTIANIAAGTRTVTAMTAMNGWYSEASEGVEVEVAAGYTWNDGQIGYTKGDFGIESITIDDTKYYNYSRYDGVSASGTTEDMAASNAIDGNVESRWASSATDPNSITVNLGDVYTVKAIAALWETASSKDFTIEVSTDGTSFTPVAVIENAPSGADRYDLITLTEAVEAQYVRITGTSRTTQWGHSLWELGIYGPDPYKEADTETTTVIEGEEKPAAPEGLAYTGNADLPYYWAWGQVKDAASYNVYIMDVEGNVVKTVTGLVERNFNDNANGDPYLATAAAGTYTIGVTAVSASGLESDMATIQYTKEAEESEPDSSTEETTPEPSSEEDSSDADDTEWIVVPASNDEFWYADANKIAVVNVQQPGFASEQGIYMTTSAAIGSIAIDGVVVGSESVAIDGAGAVVYLSALKSQISTVTYYDVNGNELGNIRIKNVNGEEPTTEAPTVSQPDIEIDDNAWVELTGMSNNNSRAYIQQSVVESFGDGSTNLRGFKKDNTNTDWWGSMSENDNMYAIGYFGIQHPTGVTITSVIIDGIEYTSDDENVLFRNRHAYINSDLLELEPGEEKVYIITYTGSTIGTEGTIAVKVRGEFAPDISGVTLPSDDEWFKITAGAGSADGSTWYVPTATNVIGGDVRELENKGSDVAWGGDGNNTLTVPVFGFSMSTGNPETIWVDGVKLSSDQIYINTNVVSIAQSVFAVTPGETKIFYVTARNANGTDNTFPVKIEGPEPTATWSDWVAMNDASGANTVDYYYSTLSSNTIGVHADTRELPNTIIAVFTEGLSSAKLNGVDVTFNGAGVEINKSELVKGQEYILEVVNADPVNVKTSSVKFKYDPAPTYTPTGVTVTTNRGNDAESTEDDGAIVSWINSEDAVAEGCNYVIELKSGDTVLATAEANSLNTTAWLDLSDVDYGTYDVVITTYKEGTVVDTQTITYKYLDPYAVESTVNFNNTLWEKFRYQTVTWTKVEAAKEYAIYADGVLVGTTTDLTYNIDAYNYANDTNANGQATTVGNHTTTVVAVFEGDAVPESLDAVNTGRVMGTNDFALNVNYIYGKGTDKWNDSGVDSKWNFTVSEAVAGQISEGASVTVDYDATGAAELVIVDNGKHDGGDQEWTIKAAIYDEAILNGEKINLKFDIIGPADLVGQSIAIKCCSEEVDNNGIYTGAEAIYKEASYTFEELKDEEGNVIGSIIHYSEAFDSTHDSYDLLFGLGELEPTTLTLTDASATKVYGVTSVSASGIVNTENTNDNKMYISWETDVPDLLKNYYTYTLKVYDANGGVVIEDDNAKSGTIYEGMNADLVAGTYRVEVSSVFDGTITATKETTATIDVNAALQPDLVVSDISIVDPSKEYRIGDTVSFNVTMTNIGSKDATLTAGNITMWLFVKNPTTGALENVNYYIKDYVDGSVTLAKGESITKSVVYTITDKHCLEDYLFTFTARADADGTIEESNEANNEYSKIFMFNPALEVVSFANNDGVISASWPSSADTTLELYKIEYVNADGEKVTVNSKTPSITLPDGTWFKNDSQVSVTAVCNDGTTYLYAEGVARADLVIESMNPVDGIAIVGEKVNFVAVVKNIGVAPATSKEGSTQEVAVTFTSGSLNGLYASDYVISEDNQPIYKILNPNDSSTIYLYSNYAPTVAGTENYSAVTDDINRILESKDTVGTEENNNTYEGEFIVLNPSDLDLELNEPEGETSYVSATWTDNNILETSDPKLTVTGYKITYTNAAGETKTVDVDKSLNTYVFTEELMNNSDVIISASYEEYGEDYVQIARTKALADLTVTEIIVPYETGDGIEGKHLYSEREYKIEVVIKNIGTASVPPALVPEDDPFLEYGKWILGNLQSTPSDYFECVDTPANYSTEGLVAGETDTLTFERVTFNAEGEYTITGSVDYPGHVEAEEGGYITESNEDNNSLSESFSVKFIQNTEMDWTRLVYDDGTGTEYLFPVASGSQNAYIDYKILSTTETNYHYEDIINKYVGYNGANMSIGFEPSKTIVYFDDGKSSYTKFEFAQVPNWNEFEYEYEYDENGKLISKTVKLDENGNPVEVTPDENSKELVWITQPTKATTIYDANGNVIKETDVSDSPMGYNGNGFNFFVGNFGLYKCYLMKFTTPVPALDNLGNYTYDADGNMLFEHDDEGNIKYDELVVAFRVTDDTIRTNNWMQSLASDGKSNPNTLPIPYCGGDSYANGDEDGVADTVKDIIYADGENKHQIVNVDKSTVIDDTFVTDNEHEDTEASRNYETIGAIWYDASDILLSSVSIYNGNWLSIATSEYLEFSKGDQDNQGTKHMRVGIARATVDPAQNNKFVGYATDFVVTDPNKEGTHLGIQGTNTVHVGLPWLLEELPVHSDSIDVDGVAAPKDRDYYWIRVWADIENIQETVILEDGSYTQLANYIDIPITVYYDVPQIQPAQNVTAITSYDDNDQEIFTLSWGALAEMNAYGYKYKVFYTNDNEEDVDITLDLAKSSGLDTSGYVEGTEYYFDSPQALTSNADIYDLVATYDSETNTVNGSLKVVAYWCEQSIPVVVDIQPPHEAGWYSFDGEHEINILAGKSKPIEINGYMSYYYDRSDNHSSGTIGYNGYFVSLNGNTRWFASDSKVSVATGTDSRFVSRSDMTTVYNDLYQVVDNNQNDDTGALAKATVDDAEKDLNIEFKTIENESETGYVAGQLQIESKDLFQATNHVTWYLVKVETPVSTEEGNETVRVAYIMMESIVEVGGDVSVRGFQMNTDATPGAVSEFSPSFRVVSRSSKLVADNTDAVGLNNDGINIDLGADKPLYAEGTLNSAVEAIVAQGTIFGLDTEGIDDRLQVDYDVETNTATPKKVQKTDANGESMVDEEGNPVYYDDVYQIQTTAGGIFTNWSGSVNDADKDKYTYYGMTFKPMNYTVKALSDVYAIRAYMVTEEGDIIYEAQTADNDPVKSASVYTIAEALYQNSYMSSVEEHEFLYNNVLNVTSIYRNYYDIATVMFNKLGINSTSHVNYKYVNNAYKDLYYYARMAMHYAADSYINRGTFISKADVDGVYNEKLLLPLLNGVKENSDTDYATVADWIYNEVDHSIGFYEKVEYVTPDTNETVDAGTQV